MALPYTGMDFVPFDVLTAEELDKIVENIESLSSGSGLASGIITNAMLSTATGELGAGWRSWTPTLTGITGGTLNYAKYTQAGKTVHFRLKYTLAGAGVSAAINISVPVVAHSDYNNADPVGQAQFLDTGITRYSGEVVLQSASALELRPLLASATYTTIAATSSTTPFTWASGDVVLCSGTYEAA